MALFINTIACLLKSLNEDQFSKVPKAIEQWHTTDSEGWFGLGPAEQKLQGLAEYLYELMTMASSLKIDLF